MDDVSVALSNDPTIVSLIQDYGFPIVMVVGLGYFVYFVWKFISDEIEPEIEKTISLINNNFYSFIFWLRTRF